MRLGIYGGAFSPVHNAHIEIARAFEKQYAIDKLLIIPTGTAPHKHIEQDVSSLQRLEMCKLAFAGLPNTEVSDTEIVRSGKSYTVITLRELSKLSDELYMLIGSDKLTGLGKWYCAEEIFGLCTIICAKRKGDDSNAEAVVAEYKSKFGAKIEMLNAGMSDISSKRIRELISKGDSVSDLIPIEVYRYIKENGLYLNKNEQ